MTNKELAEKLYPLYTQILPYTRGYVGQTIQMSKVLNPQQLSDTLYAVLDVLMNAEGVLSEVYFSLMGGASQMTEDRGQMTEDGNIQDNEYQQ